MKKIILCCVVVVLTMIVCVIPSFAVQGSFNVDLDILTDYHDLMTGVILGDYSFSVVYTFEVPFYDNNNGVAIDSVEISYDVDGEVTATCYNDIDPITFTDMPDIESRVGLVNYDTYDSNTNITHEDVMRLFGVVFPGVPISVIPVNSISPIESIFNAFGSVLSWLPVAVVSLIGIFWTGSELTFLGILSVCGLAIAVFLLIFALISKFLRFRG